MKASMRSARMTTVRILRTRSTSSWGRNRHHRLPAACAIPCGGRIGRSCHKCTSIPYICTSPSYRQARRRLAADMEEGLARGNEGDRRVQQVRVGHSRLFAQLAPRPRGFEASLGQLSGRMKPDRKIGVKLLRAVEGGVLATHSRCGLEFLNRDLCVTVSVHRNPATPDQCHAQQRSAIRLQHQNVAYAAMPRD